MFTDVLAILGGLGFLGGFISVLVNIGKALKVVKDGTGDQWFQGLNILAFLVVGTILVFKVPVDWTAVNVVLGVLISILGFVLQLITGKGTYVVTKGLPLIGYSYSEKAEKAQLS